MITDKAPDNGCGAGDLRDIRHKEGVACYAPTLVPGAFPTFSCFVAPQSEPLSKQHLRRPLPVSNEAPTPTGP